MIAGVGLLISCVIAFSAPQPFVLAPFREAMTAISARDLPLKIQSLWYYPTAVRGAPWQIPIEFGLFQVLTAAISRLIGHLALAGRLLSLGLSILNIALVWRLVRVWFPGEDRRLATLAAVFMICAPIYQAVSTAHLIESLALALGLTYASLATPFRDVDHPGRILLAVLFGILTAIVKLTTWAPFAVFVGLDMGLQILADLRGGERRLAVLRRLGVAAGLALLPLAAGYWWTNFAKGIRLANPVAPLSDATAVAWNFGDLSLRLRGDYWLLLAGKHGLLMLGPAILVVPFLLYRGLPRVLGSPLKRLVGLAFAAYLAHVVVFLPLQLRHEYYLAGSGVFLSLIVAVVVHSIGRLSPPRRVALAMVVAAFQIVGAWGYLALKRSYEDVEAQALVDALNELPGSGPVVILGFDWTPWIPFLGHRRALMLDQTSFSDAEITALAAANDTVRYEAVAYLEPQFSAAALQLGDALKIPHGEVIRFGLSGVIDTDAAAPMGDEVASGRAQKRLAELGARVGPQASLSDGIVYLHLPFASDGTGHGFEIVVKRGFDAFYLRLPDMSLVRVRGYFRPSSGARG